jgi:hypothetical protein
MLEFGDVVTLSAKEFLSAKRGPSADDWERLRDVDKPQAPIRASEAVKVVETQPDPEVLHEKAPEVELPTKVETRRKHRK